MKKKPFDRGLDASAFRGILPINWNHAVLPNRFVSTGLTASAIWMNICPGGHDQSSHVHETLKHQIFGKSLESDVQVAMQLRHRIMLHANRVIAFFILIINKVRAKWYDRKRLRKATF